MSNTQEHEFDVIDPVRFDNEDYGIGNTIKLSDQKIIDRLKELKCIAEPGTAKVNAGPAGVAEQPAPSIDSETRKAQIAQQMADLQAELEVLNVSTNLGDTKSSAPEDPAVRKAAIVGAIGLLDKDDKTHWIGNGAPDANVLTELLGWKVKADERNQIWMDINSDK